jgi:ubiquitin C-terminal hydrolase
LPQLNLKLEEIPEILINSGKTYELRGVGCFRCGPSNLRTSVGHYFGYCKRGQKNWQLYDDLQSNVKYVNERTTVPCEYLVYTV